MKELSYFVYEIYPKSFKDTSGNGYGDINGITSKIKYIKSVGFDYIWLTPMYVSPQNDNGYDVEDYYNIDPLFGTDEDFDNLVKECKNNNIKIMMDMVFNHTSSNHEWFQKALLGDEEFMNYYIFRDKEHITTWESKFGGNTWEYVENLDKYYLHLFDKTQPDLNWENPKVREELYKVVNFWIKKGVHGFRFDVINLISKKYPLQNGTGDGRDQYTDGPKIHEFIQDLRKNTFANNDDILTVGEMSSTSIDQCVKYANKDRTELDTVFHFHHLKVDYKDNLKWTIDYFDFNQLKSLMSSWQLAMQESDVVDTLFWSNHDQPRIASRFIKANNKEQQNLKNKTLAMLMYLQRGISYIFQGEEIGMENLEISDINEIVDIESINFYNSSTLDKNLRLKILSEKSRDNGRTPMQWCNKSYGDFSTEKPWLNINKNFETINVENQINDENSTLNFYKELISLKKNDDILINGKIEFIDHDKLFIYTRKSNNKKYKVICNLFNESIIVKEDIKNVLLNNGTEIIDDEIKILPFSSILFEY